MPPRTRLIRRAPLLERIKASIDPLDFLLWLSEKLNGDEWDSFQKQWSTPLGIALNVLFMVARANAGSKSNDVDPDVFGDAHEQRASGWLAWFASLSVSLLALISFLNAFFTFWRTKNYRLFETSIETAPSTPSAHRVRVDASPVASSPLRYLQQALGGESADARAHPRSTRDVWEINVWDPTPMSLRLFCLFSPGHVMVYWLFLPLAPLDPRPSVTVITTVFLVMLLSIQMSLLQSYFAQQSKDSSIIFKEVQNEYDTKFVQPIIHKPVRSAGTQCLSGETPRNTHEVLVSTPTTYVNRGFNTNPNPNYASHYDPEAHTPQASYERLKNRSVMTPNLRSPAINSVADVSSPLRPTPVTHFKQPRIDTGSQITANGNGGSLGVYSHSQSPLRKSTGRPTAFGQLSAAKRPNSPLKRASTLHSHGGQNGVLQDGVSHTRNDVDKKGRVRRPY